MAYLRLLSIVLGLWGAIELLMALAGATTNELGVSKGFAVAAVCIAGAVIMNIIYKLLKKRNNRYRD